MRLIIGTDDGIHVARWIPGERSAHMESEALSGEEVTDVDLSRTRIFVSTRSGDVHRSDDRGKSFRRTATVADGRGVSSLCALSHHPDTLFAGTEPAGVYSSHDAGENWTELAAFGSVAAEGEWRGYGDREAHVRALAYDPQDEHRMYVGVEIGGAYRTDDGGRSWLPINDGIYDDIHVLRGDPNRSGRVYAATGGGLYLSADRGTDWVPQSGEIGSVYCTDLALEDLADETRLFLTTADGPPSSWESGEGPGAAVHRSDDGGETWTDLDLRPLYPSREAFTAVATEPEERSGVFVGTSEGALHYGDPEMEGWSRLLRGLSPIRALVVA